VTYFAEVAKQKSFTKAASTLHVSQPSLSKTIKSLEDTLGTTLFYRGAKQLQLTDTGEVFLANVKHVLDAFDNLTAELDDVGALKKGEIKIGIPPIIGAAFFSSLISKYIELYPSIHMSLHEVGSNKIKQGVSEDELDIGLICNLPIQKENYETIGLLKDPLVLIAHKDNPLARRSAIRFSDLEEEPMILYKRDFSLHDRIMEACSSHGFYPNVVCESSQKDFIIEMVEAKLGAALLPSKICSQLSNKNIKAIPFDKPAVHLELAMIWKKDKYLSHAVREFIKMAESEV
jgi:DNA-binding transcriptional LysR family regulator